MQRRRESMEMDGWMEDAAAAAAAAALATMEGVESHHPLEGPHLFDRLSVAVRFAYV